MGTRGWAQYKVRGLPEAHPQLRHPNVLQFKDSVELEASERGGPVTLYLVTEAVTPLSTLLQELRLSDAQRCCASGRRLRRRSRWARRDDYLAMGLSQVAQAVAFLNVDCKMVRALQQRCAPRLPNAPHAGARQRVSRGGGGDGDIGLAAARLRRDVRVL